MTGGRGNGPKRLVPAPWTRWTHRQRVLARRVLVAAVLGALFVFSLAWEAAILDHSLGRAIR